MHSTKRLGQESRLHKPNEFLYQSRQYKRRTTTCLLLQTPGFSTNILYTCRQTPTGNLSTTTLSQCLQSRYKKTCPLRCAMLHHLVTHTPPPLLQYLAVNFNLVNSAQGSIHFQKSPWGAHFFFLLYNWCLCKQPRVDFFEKLWTKQILVISLN